MCAPASFEPLPLQIYQPLEEITWRCCAKTAAAKTEAA